MTQGILIEGFGLVEWSIVIGGPLITGLVSMIGTSLASGAKLGAAEEKLARLRDEFDAHVRAADALSTRFEDSMTKMREGQAEMRSAMATRADLEHLGSQFQAGMLAISTRIDNVFHLQKT